MNVYNMIGRYIVAALLTLIVALALTKALNLSYFLAGFLSGAFFIWALDKVENG